MSVTRGELTVRLYPKSVASTTLEVDLTQRISRLRFSTALHGGFSQCSFHLALPWGEAWLWYDTFARWKRIQVYEAGWGIVWEGAVEDTELILGGVNVLALGYWASCFYFPHMNGTAPPVPYSYNANQTAYDIIDDVLTQSCPLISADHTNLADPGLILATAADPYAPADKTPAQIIMDCAAAGNGTATRWWFAVWNGRIPYLVAQAVSGPDWIVRLSDFTAGGFSLRKTPTDYASRCYALYLAAGVLTRTNEASDATVEAANVRKTHVVASLGEVDAGVATGRRDVELAWRKVIHPQSRFTVQAVRDSNGLQRPLWRVRAGDTLRIVDLVPATSGLTTVALDQLRTFYLRRTEFDADSQTLTVEPEAAVPNLGTQLAKAGVV